MAGYTLRDKADQRQHFRLGALLILVALSLPAAAGGEDVPPLAEQLVEVETDLWIAGELNLQALAARRSASPIVIDLRTAEEGTAEERAAVEALGLRYVNVPVEGAEIHDEDLAELTALLNAVSGQPVILHCASGNRASMLWGAIQLDAGRSLSDVLSAVSGIAIKPEVREALRARASAEAADSAAPSPRRGAAAH